MATRKRNPERENAQGLAELRRLAGAGGPPGQFAPARVHGRYATATIGSATLHLFDWEVTFDMESFDATAHGEFWKTRVPGDQSWTARARGYFVASDAAYLATAAVANADPGTVVFTGYATMSTAGTKVWEGPGLITRASFSAPMAMVVQEMEITSSGVPTGGT